MKDLILALESVMTELEAVTADCKAPPHDYAPSLEEKERVRKMLIKQEKAKNALLLAILRFEELTDE